MTVFLPIFAGIRGCCFISSTWKFIFFLVDIIVLIDFLLGTLVDYTKNRHAAYFLKLNVVIYFAV